LSSSNIIKEQITSERSFINKLLTKATSWSKTAFTILTPSVL